MEGLAVFADALPYRQAPVDTIRTQASERNGVCWHMLRLDLLDDGLSGNKLFKLLPYLQRAVQCGATTLLSFGGMHSNHLYALAVAGRRFGFATVGIVRGYAGQPVSPTLSDLVSMGMEIVFADRKTYARRYHADYQQELAQQFNALVIPEGGAGQDGIAGAGIMHRVLQNSIADRPDIIALAAGTGAGFYGLLQAVEGKSAIRAYPVLYNAGQIEAAMLARGGNTANAFVVDGYQLGGLGKMPVELARFMVDFEAQQELPLDPVYTARLCYAIDDEIRRGVIAPGSHVVSLHSGGLQGRRAMQSRIVRQAARRANNEEVKYECA